jgi:PAS domain S-box-containing protein
MNMPGESSFYTNQQEHLQLLKALRESELLREFSELLASSLDPTHILQVLVRRTTEVCEVERCAVWLLDTTRDIFLPSAYHVSSEHMHGKNLQIADKVWHRSSLPFNDPLVHRLFQNNGMLALEDLTLEASPSIHMVTDKFLVRSILLVALVREGRPVGMMSLDNPGQNRTFSLEQQQFVRAIGQQAAVAIDNAQLYQEAQKERNRAERLIERVQSTYQVATSVNSGKPLSTVLEIAIKHLISGAEATGAAIVLLDNDIVTLAHMNGLHPLHARLKLPIPLQDLPHCFAAAMTGKSAFVTRASTADKEHLWYEQVGLEHVLIVPLMIGVQNHKRRREHEKNEVQQTHCAGFAFINYPPSLHHPLQRHYAFALDIATQCALAIEKDQILEKVRHTANLATERAHTLDAILNAMNEGIIVLDMDGQVIVNNSTVARFLGLTGNKKESLLTIFQHQPAYTLDGRLLSLEDFPLTRALNGTPIRNERFMGQRTTDNSERIVEVNSVPLFDDEAQQVGIVCAFRDITEQFRVERRIRNVLDALLHAAEIVSDAGEIKEILHRILVMSLRALSCERGVVQSYDQDTQTFTPLVALGFADGDDTRWLNEQKHWLEPTVDTHTGFRSQIVAGHATLVNEEQSPDHPERFRDTMILAAPIIYNNHLFGVMMLDRSHLHTKNQPTIAATSPKRTFNVWEIAVVEGIAQFAGLAIEQTLWQHEAEIARTNEATMRVSNELKDEFLAITAHEFRTPLTIILAHSQMMARILRRIPGQDPNTASRLHESITSVETQTRQLTNIVNTFLEVTRLNRGQITLTTEIINMEEIIAESVNNYSATSTLHAISYTIESAQLPYIVNGDRARLLQIFANLLQNAIKYSPPEGVITVTLRQVSSGGRQPIVEVSVQDQGIGIPKDAQSRLFERFYRAPNIAGGQTRGVGLGLYIVAEFLHMHGGTIRVESRGIPGEGSCFIFTLPLLEIEDMNS